MMRSSATVANTACLDNDIAWLDPYNDLVRKVCRTSTHVWPYSESDWAWSEALAAGQQAYLFE